MILKNINTTCISILIILGICFSCQNSRQSYLKGILSNVCFWDVLDKDFNVKNIKHTYRLLPDGVCYMYRYNYVNNEKQNSVSPMDKEKGEVDIKWHVKSDSVLTIEKMDYKVLIVDKNYILLEPSSSPSFILQKNCQTFIID